MSDSLTREQRIATIVQTLRPADPGSWGANIVYVTAEFDSHDAAQRAEIKRLKDEVIAYKHSAKSVEAIEAERDDAENQVQELNQSIETLTGKLSAMTTSRDQAWEELNNKADANSLVISLTKDLANAEALAQHNADGWNEALEVAAKYLKQRDAAKATVTAL